MRWFQLSLVLLLLGGYGVAQTGSRISQVPPPPRQGYREAVDRSPVVLETWTLPEKINGTVVELAPEADAHIASERPDDNFGTASLYLGYNLNGNDHFGAERAFLRFDVSSIPTGSVIHSAYLRLYVNWSDPTDDAPMGTVLRRTASPWNEYTITWNGEPAWGEIRATADVGAALDWYAWDVTDLVADWTADVYPNYGVEIIGDEQVQQRERAFYARETTTDFYPRLLVDYTDYDDNSPPAVYVDDLPNYVLRNFTVSWSGTDPGGSGIASYDVQYRGNGGDWITWITETTSTSAEFNGGDGWFYEFRARGVDNAGNVEPFGDPEAQTTVDASSPVSLVTPLSSITHTVSFTVHWSGQDTGSGIKYYDIQYRFNTGDWAPWQQHTIATGAEFTTMKDGLYEFEARAVDNLDQEEPFANRAEARILVDAREPFLVPRAWLPLVTRQRDIERN